jgi:predicted nucleic acid-binding protein
VIVVIDSTVLIGLAKLGKIPLLKQIFSKVSIPEEVFKEVVERGKDKIGSKLIMESRWIETKAVKDKTQVSFLMGSLDRGEAEVLALARELEANLILLDEEKARKSAVIAGFNVMGLLGLFNLSKNMGLVDEVRPLVDELLIKKFRISDKVIEETLRRAGEPPINPLK